MATQRAGSARALTPPAGLDAVLLVVALAGVSFSGPLIAATAAPALAIAFWRNALGGAVSAAWALVRDPRALPGLSGRTWALTVGAGVSLTAHFGTWIPSLTMTTVASSTALVSMQGVFTAAIAHRRGERLPRAAWVGIVVAVVGAGLVTGADLGVSGRAIVGDLLALVGGLAAAVYVTLGAQAREKMTTPSYTAVCYLVCALALLAVCGVGGVSLHGYSGNAWVKIALVTVLAQLLGHSLFTVVLRSISPTVLSLAILFETPGAALIALVWLHQRPPLTAVPGVVLLLGGVALVARTRPEPEVGGEALPDQAL